MSDELVRYVEFLKKQKAKALADEGRAKRAVLRIEEKLADPESAFKFEHGRGHKKVSRIVTGEEKPKKVILKKAEKNEAEKVVELVEFLRDEGFETSSAFHDDKEKKSGFGFF